MKYFSNKCKNIVSKNRKPCKKYGCQERLIEISFSESLKCRDYVIGKINNYLTSKSKMEFSGDFSFLE